MKKRIISLILVAVMSVLALASCGYSYAKDDMAKYANFNKDAFLAALADGSIVIEDADFGVDADRDTQVMEAIMKTVAKGAGTDNKATEGKLNKYDVFYYCYYATAVVDGKEHIFYAGKMAQDSASNFQLGLADTTGINAKIEELFAGKELVKENIYETITSDDSNTADVVENKTVNGQTVYVSYKMQYSQYMVDKDGNPIKNDDGTQKIESKTVTVAFEKVVLNGTEAADSLAFNLEGKTVGNTYEFETTDDRYVFEGEDKKDNVKYTNVKVNWIVDNEADINYTFTDKTFTTSKEETNVYGDKIQLKDAQLTYHVFPVYFVSIGDDVTAEMVLEYFYNSVVATEEHSDDEEEHEDGEHKHPYSFASLQDGGFKNGDKTLAELAEELVEIRSELTTAEKEVTDAKKALDGATSSTTAEQKAELEKKLDDANKKVEEVKAKKEAAVKSILECTNDKAEDVKAALVQDLKAYQYETLENTYKNAIKQSLAKEVYALAQKNIEYKVDDNGWWLLPRKAVRDAYNRIENNHKYTFYTGTFEQDTSSSTGSTSSTNKESNYKHYNGDFDEYLKVEYFGKDAANYDMQDVYDKMGAEAEQAVKDIVLVYTLVNLFSEKYDKDLSVTDKQIENLKLTYIWYFYGEIMTEDDYMTALLLDNLMNFVLEENEEAEGNKIDYTRVEYGFKAEEAEEK